MMAAACLSSVIFQRLLALMLLNNPTVTQKGRVSPEATERCEDYGKPQSPIKTEVYCTFIQLSEMNLHSFYSDLTVI